MDLKTKTFVDSNRNRVAYDGSPITWRVSAYSLIVEDERIFLVKGKGEETYDLPGGGVELGEQVEDALKREAMEEAGLTIEPIKLVSYYQDYFYHRTEKKFYQTMLLYFISKRVGETQKPTDPAIEFAQFVPLSKLDNYNLWEYIQQAIQAVL